MIDKEGLRLNVGIILANEDGQLFWGRRVGSADAWQFPQGGLMEHETPEQAMYRELTEELGLAPDDVDIIAESERWHLYYLPKYLRRYRSKPLVIGQKQKWFLLQLKAAESQIRFDLTGEPEFSQWRWVDYWYPVRNIIAFKREVYKKVLKEFETILFPNK